MNQHAYPFRICDISLPSSRTGFAYFSISVKDKSFTYIGSTIRIMERPPQYYSGYGSFETYPNKFRPYMEITLITNIFVISQKENGRYIETHLSWARNAG